MISNITGGKKGNMTQIYWEDIEEGNEITPLEKKPNTQNLVKWAGASGDFNPLHYEDTFAKTQRMEGPIVHGQLKRAWLTQMLIDWIGEDGDLLKFSCQFRAMDYPCVMKDLFESTGDDHPLICKGKVTKKYTDADKNCLNCDIWIENAKGESGTIGKATVALPIKG